MSLATAVRAGMALMLLLVAWPVAHAAEGTPTDILKGIYREAVKGTASDWLEPRRRGGFLSASLLAEWAKLDAKKAPENDVGPIDFDLSAFTHRAIYNCERHRIEMHLISKKSQTVRMLGTSFSFRPGESIHTENSYKYSLERFAALARGTGWQVRDTWTDEATMFSVHALEAAG